MLDKHRTNKGEDLTKFKEYEGSLIIKQYSGINSENFVIKKFDGKKLSFSFFKINRIYYVNINGEHIIDYKSFVNIKQISKIDDTDGDDENSCGSIKVKNNYIGDFIVKNCDTEIFQKALSVMSEYMRNKTSYMSDIMYFIFR